MSSNTPAPPPPFPPTPVSGGHPQLTITLPSEQRITKCQPVYELNAEQEFLDTRNQLWELEGWKEPPLLTVYQYLPSILQEGPQ